MKVYARGVSSAKHCSQISRRSSYGKAANWGKSHSMSTFSLLVIVGETRREIGGWKKCTNNGIWCGAWLVFSGKELRVVIQRCEVGLLPN